MASNDPHVKIIDEHSEDIKGKLTVSDGLLSLLVQDKIITHENSADLQHLLKVRVSA
jgi:hypothetical protein